MSSSLPGSSSPAGRHDFEIALFCALSLEAHTIETLFDKHWDSQLYGKAAGDINSYSLGTIAGHNVVLVCLPNMGKVAAATAAAFLRTSYEAVRLALVVGVCGGVPARESSDEGIILGDAVISDGVIQYDFGRQYPHTFIRKDHVRDNLPRPSPLVRTFLAKLQVNRTRIRLQETTAEHLTSLQKELGITVAYPGVAEDQLFKPTYRHKHDESAECSTCNELAGVCDEALKLSCNRLGCNEQELVCRVRSTPPPGTPVIHFGLVASGDSVMKSGEDRDKAASEHGVIAFEMEGAGLWEIFPSCLIIKGVCDYADSHKSKKWQAYAAAVAAATTKAVLGYWDDRSAYPLRSVSYNQVPIMTDTGLLESTRRVPILRMLNGCPYWDIKERNPDRVEGTCDWFVTHESFRQWRESTSSSMLWVSADPGCGKSVLAKYLVDSELPTTESRTTCYFFFKDDFVDQKSAITALCCILHQLFKQRGALLSEDIAERFESDGEDLIKSFSGLWDVLVTASKAANSGEIVCILDAFDECEHQGRAEFTRYLRKFYGTRNDFHLKFLLTSRPYGDIRRGFQPLQIPELPVIHLSGENEIEMEKIAKEIDIYIKFQVRSIRGILGLTRAEEKLLLQELLRVPNRTYLWAHLTLDVVQNDINIDKAGIYKATSQLPKTVDEVYERILAKSRDVDAARRLLHIVVAATRPLTLSEMQLALALDKNLGSHKDFDPKSEARFREYVRDVCGLFVAIIESKIYLLHQTAKEFLVQDSIRQARDNPRNHLIWKSSLRTHTSHRILSMVCIWHLFFIEYENSPLDDNLTLPEHLRRHVFLGYSAENWATHFRMSHIQDQDNEVNVLMLRICKTTLGRCPTWFRIYWKSTHGHLPQNFTTLMIASYFGFEKLVETLLDESRAEINYIDSTNRRSAISWASENGFDDVVRLLIRNSWVPSTLRLLTNGVNIESRDQYGRTPLSYAARKGHVDIVRRLVRAGARVDSEDKIGGTPISYALCHKQTTILSLLIPGRHLIDSPNTILRRLLLSAAQKGDEDTVQLLLDSDMVHVNSADHNGQTPLSWAAENGHKTVSKILLEHNETDANLADHGGWTPLLWAVTNSREDTIRLLLESSKVNANLGDKDCRTAISRAAERGQGTIVTLLLSSNKVNANLGDKTGLTPLSWAVIYNRETVVRLLLASGKVDPNLADDDGRTPLLRAAKHCREAIAYLLIQNGVDPNLADKHGRTALSWAARRGCEAIVQWLLECPNIDINIRDNSGRTPLLWAVENRHDAVIRLLR